MSNDPISDKKPPPQLPSDIEVWLADAKKLFTSDPPQSLHLATTALTAARERQHPFAIMLSLLTVGVAKYELSNNTEALSDLTQVLEMARELEHHSTEIYCARFLGVVSLQLGQMNEALNYLQSCLDLMDQTQLQADRSLCLNDLGTVYREIGDYEKALFYFDQCLELARTQQNDLAMAMVSNNIGLVYEQMNDLEAALASYRDSLALARKVGSKRGESICLVNIGLIHGRQKAYAQALDYFAQSFDIKVALNDRIGMGFIHHVIGNAYEDQHQYDQALVEYEKGLAIARVVKNPQGQAKGLVAIGKNHFFLGHLNEAIDPLLEGVELAKANGLRVPQANGHEYLALCYQQLGDFERAFDHFRQFHDLNKLIHDEQAEQHIRQITTRLQVEKYQREAEKEKLKRTELGETLERVQKLNTQLVELGEEKSELVKMVSHNLKNPLSAINLWVDILQENMSRLSPEETQKKLAKIKLIAKQMAETIDHFLDVERVDEEGFVLDEKAVDLVDLVIQQVSGFQTRAAQKSIQLEVEIPFPYLSIQSDEAALNEVIENLISNAIKYSPPITRTVVRLSKTPDMVQLVVQDEGPGFAPVDIDRLFKKFSKLGVQPTGKESSHGLGLYMARRLVDKLGGRITASSPGPGQGSTFLVELPNSSLDG